MNKKTTETFLIAATSKDGFISPLDQTTESSTKWTSAEDTKFFREKTLEAGVVVYGSKTYQTIPQKYRPLKNRINIVYTRNPQLIDSGTTQEVNQNTTRALEKNIPYITKLPPKELISLLHSLDHQNIAICGGQSIYQQFFDANVVDTIYQTIEEVEFGKGIPFLSEDSHSKLKEKNTIPLSDKTVVKIFDVVK